MTRSEIMARVRARNTSPELAVRRALYASGLRYRVHQRVHGARPDIVFGRRKIAVFIDGCFWHMCPVHFRLPSTNAAYWKKKVNSNVERDSRQDRELKALGWTVLRFWEHEVDKDVNGIVARIALEVSALSIRSSGDHCDCA